jgi:hypothetical protein
MRSARILGSALAIAGLVSASRAEAVGPIDVEVAARLDYGFSGAAYGPGVGVRAGVSFAGFYAGMSFVDYAARPTALDNGPITTIGAEVGYGIKIASITIRPLVGVGYWNESLTPCESYTGVSVSTLNCAISSPYLQPGLLVAVSVWHVLVGLDADALLPIGVSTATPDFCPPVDSSPNAFLIGGQVGARF